MEIHELQILLRTKGISVSDDDPIFLVLLLNDIVLESVGNGLPLGINPLKIKRMQQLLFERGVRIKDDDPIFALLALNEIALEKITKEHLSTLSRANPKIRISASLGSAIAGCGVCFVFFGNGSSHLIVGVVGVLLGGALGGLLGWLAATRHRHEPRRDAGNLPALRIEPTSWTNEDFHRAAAMTPRLESSLREACRKVLVDGATLGEVANSDVSLPLLLKTLSHFTEVENLFANSHKR